MKILFITDLFPVKSGEINTSKALYNFVIEWIKQGHSVDVIKPNFIFNSFLRGKPFYKTGFYELNGVKVFNVNYWTPFMFDIKKKFGKKDKNYFTSNYDVIISHMPSGIIFANKLNIDIPLICAVHRSDIEVLRNPIYKFYFRTQLKAAYKKSKKIACRSFILQKEFNKLMPEFATKTFVASSGIGQENKKNDVRDGDFAKQNRLNSQFTTHYSLITCANLIKRKNIDKLILAVNELDDFELKIIGDGKELKNLQHRVKLLPDREKISFLGRLAHEKVLEEMQKADIFVLPSVHETFGLVYLEAMASGCVTVCTKNDGIDGIIKEGENGFLTEPTVEGIKETLLKIKNSSNLEKILENSFNTVKEYSAENCATNYLKNITNQL